MSERHCDVCGECESEWDRLEVPLPRPRFARGRAALVRLGYECVHPVCWLRQLVRLQEERRG
jgi:hypothetical protein